MVSLNLVYFVKGPVRFTDHQLLGEVPKFSTGICPWTPLEDFLPSVSRRTTPTIRPLPELCMRLWQLLQRCQHHRGVIRASVKRRRLADRTFIVPPGSSVARIRREEWHTKRHRNNACHTRKITQNRGRSDIRRVTKKNPIYPFHFFQQNEKQTDFNNCGTQNPEDI